MLVLTVVLTAVVALALGLAPAKLARRRVRQCDLGWAAGLWLATWVFALCAYHRLGLTVGFDAFRLAAITALCGWASFCVAGLRSFGGRGLRFVVPLLLAAALGSEVFVGNVTYFNTHSYQPFQLLDYLDPNVNVIRGQGSISLDEDHTYMRFLDIDQPIYNLSMDGLTNDDTDPLHWDSFFNFRINATDEGNSRLNYFGTWQIAPESTRSQVISLDLTGNVGTMELTASGYSTAFATFPVAVTFTGITANAPRPLQFSLLRCIAVFLALLAIYALRPQSGLWHRRWLAGNVCDRAAGAVLAVILAAFVVVVPFWEPGNTGLATENYNVAFWDHESKISFVYEQYGALAHSLLNGRLDLMQDPPEELLALDNPYDSTAREEAQVNSLWDHAYYNGRYYVYFGIVPCLLFQLPFEAVTGIQNLAYPPCMIVMGLLFLLASFGAVHQVVRRWFSQASSAAYLLSVAAIVLGIVAVFVLLGGGILKFFGFQYDSKGAFLGFFALYFLISLPCDLLVEGLPKALWALGRLRRPRLFRFLLSTAVDVAILELIDGWMPSVSVPTVAAVALGCASAYVDLWLDDTAEEKPKGPPGAE